MAWAEPGARLVGAERLVLFYSLCPSTIEPRQYALRTRHGCGKTQLPGGIVTVSALPCSGFMIRSKCPLIIPDTRLPGGAVLSAFVRKASGGHATNRSTPSTRQAPCVSELRGARSTPAQQGWVPRSILRLHLIPVSSRLHVFGFLFATGPKNSGDLFGFSFL